MKEITKEIDHNHNPHPQSNNNPIPLPQKNIRPNIGHNLLPNPNIPRPLHPTILILEVILHQHAAHNRLDGVRREETTGTSLASESKVHVGGPDADQAVGLDFGVLRPAEAVEGLRVGDDGVVAAEGAGGEADVGSLGEDEAVGEDDGLADDAVHRDWDG